MWALWYLFYGWICFKQRSGSRIIFFAFKRFAEKASNATSYLYELRLDIKSIQWLALYFEKSNWKILWSGLTRRSLFGWLSNHKLIKRYIFWSNRLGSEVPFDRKRSSKDVFARLNLWTLESDIENSLAFSKYRVS